MTEKFQYEGKLQVIFVIDGKTSKPVELPGLRQSTIYLTDVCTFAMGHVYDADDKPVQYDYTVTLTRHKTSAEKRSDGTNLKERGFSKENTNDNPTGA